MVGLKDKLSSSLNDPRDHVTSEELANSMTEHAQSFLATAKNDLSDIVEEIQVSRAFGISGATVTKRRVRDRQLQQLASIAEEVLSGAASQADSQPERTSALDAVDAGLQNSASGIELEKVDTITSFDPDDPGANMQFDDDADTPSGDPLDRISFRR